MSTTIESRIELIDIIVCEDIRQEISGKYTLVGVYPSGITVPKLPAQILFNTWIVFKCLETGRFEIEVEIRGPAKEQKINIQAEFDNNVGAGAVAPFTPNKMMVAITQVGEIQIFFRQKSDKDWSLLKIVPVEISNIQANAPSKPSNLPK